MSGRAKPLAAPRRKAVKIVRMHGRRRCKSVFRVYLECGHMVYRPAYRGIPAAADCYDCMLAMADGKACSLGQDTSMNTEPARNKEPP